MFRGPKPTSIASSRIAAANSVFTDTLSRTPPLCVYNMIFFPALFICAPHFPSAHYGKTVHAFYHHASERAHTRVILIYTSKQILSFARICSERSFGPNNSLN
jgi:hypothetical protein